MAMQTVACDLHPPIFIRIPIGLGSFGWITKCSSSIHLRQAVRKASEERRVRRLRASVDESGSDLPQTARVMFNVLIGMVM